MSTKQSGSYKCPRDLDIRVGIAIRRLRELISMTQMELAHRAKVTQSYISLIESGQRKTRLNLKTLQRIAHTLGMKRLSDLVRLAEDVPDTETVISEAKQYFCHKHK